MTDRLIYSFWSADEEALPNRVAQALEQVEAKFPVATYWHGSPSNPRGPDDHLVAETERDLERYNYSLSRLWKATADQYSDEGRSVNKFVVNSSAYSESINLAVRVYFSNCQFLVETEPEFTETALTKHIGVFTDVLRAIGASPAIGGCWLRNRSAFAGDPSYLYEPKPLFSKLSSPLTYDEVTEEVRSVRQAVRSVFKMTDFNRSLDEIGAEVELLSQVRLFVRLGDPRGVSGKDLLKKLEQRIRAELRKKR